MEGNHHDRTGSKHRQRKPGFKAPEGTLSVCLIEDDPVQRESLRHLLSRAPGLLPPRVFADGPSALRDAIKSPPDVIVVDLMLAEDSGLRFIRKVRARLPDTYLLVLTASDGDESVFTALEAGADGYLVKGEKHDEIVRAIRRAAGGEAILSSQVLRKVLAEYRLRNRRPQKSPQLSEREQCLLELTDAGCSCKEIAGRLRLSVHTVYAMNRALYARLRLNSRTAAAASPSPYARCFTSSTPSAARMPTGSTR